MYEWRSSPTSPGFKPPPGVLLTRVCSVQTTCSAVCGRCGLSRWLCSTRCLFAGREGLGFDRLVEEAKMRMGRYGVTVRRSPLLTRFARIPLPRVFCAYSCAFVRLLAAEHAHRECRFKTRPTQPPPTTPRWPPARLLPRCSPHATSRATPRHVTKGRLSMISTQCGTTGQRVGDRVHTGRRVRLHCVAQVPPQLSLYISTQPDEKINYSFAGPSGPARFEGGVAGFEASAFRGLGVVRAMPFETSDESDAVQMLQRQTQVGEYYIVGAPQYVPTQDVAVDYDTIIYDEDSDSLQRITLYSCIEWWWKALESMVPGPMSSDKDKHLSAAVFLLLGKNVDLVGSDPKQVTAANLKSWMVGLFESTAACDAYVDPILAGSFKALNGKDDLTRDDWTGLAKIKESLLAGKTPAKQIDVKFCLVRPFIEHLCMSAIVTVAGSDTGATLFGPSGEIARTRARSVDTSAPRFCAGSLTLVPCVRCQTCRLRYVAWSARTTHHAHMYVLRTEAIALLVSGQHVDQGDRRVRGAHSTTCHHTRADSARRTVYRHYT